MRDTNNVTVNQNDKDTVFRMLFSDKKNLLSLYNAVSERNYTDPDELEIVPMDNAIYMGMKDDRSFIIDMNVYLYEHQFVYNPNIPLLNLLFITSKYEKMIDEKSLDVCRMVKIPFPDFFALYNGTGQAEDKQELKLSQMFENHTDSPALELTVTMLNVNAGHNKKLMEQCQVLKEYAMYVAKVRNYAQNMEVEKAVNCAVDECIKEGILVEFLKEKKAEVIDASIFEYGRAEE